MNDKNDADAVTSSSGPAGSTQRSDTGDIRLEALFEQTATGLAEVSLDGRFTRVNQRFCEMAGRTCGELLALRMQDITDPDDLAGNLVLFRKLVETGESFEIEKRYTRPDGSRVWVKNSVSLIRDNGGKAASILAVSIDISRSKIAEEQLGETSRRLNAIINNTQMAIFVMDQHQHCVFMNNAAEDLTGYALAEMQGRSLHDVIHNKRPDGSPYPIEECPIDRAFPRNDQVQGEELFVHKEGHFYPVAFTASPIRDDSGKSIGTIVEARDIAAERARDAALRDNETRFRTVFQNAAVGMLEIDADWCILGANTAYSDITGYPLDELIGKSSLAFTHSDDIPASEAALRGVAGSESDRVRFEKRYIRKDGNIVWIRSNLSRISGTGKQARFLKVVEDITDVREAREALEEQSRILETLNSTGSAVAAELDLQRVVQLVTDAGVKLTGAQFGAFFYNVLDDDGGSYMLYTLSGADKSQFDFGMPRNTAVFHPTFSGEAIIRSDDITKDERYGKSGPHYGMPKGHLPVRSYLAVPVIGRSEEVVGGLFFGHPEPGRFSESHERLMQGLAAQAAISIDNARLYQAVQRANETLEQRVQDRTTELENANEALRQAQKMEAIGQLTGGIAHDFNNMLTVIRGSADVLRRPDLEADKQKRYLDAIAETSDRAARLTGQLLAFARRQALKPETFDVMERVQSISDMLRTVLGSRYVLQITADCDNCFIEADAAQFETALVNMAVNARDAMESQGELSIRVRRASELPRSLQPQESERYVSVSVSDTGHGIAADDLAKIFEPFFTTKEVGKGTGLGLSQVYGFAKQSGGEIHVESEVGKGTTFTIYLPEALGSHAISPKVAKEEPDLRPGGRVLVVEDNDAVGRFAEAVLAELGFEAQRANDAQEALQLLGNGSEFDVVFSDVVMPGMGGIEFAREVQKRSPNLPVVLTSGYSHVLAAQSGHGFPLLQKPYSLEGLQLALAEALHR